MRSNKFLLAAGAVSISTMAFAADLPIAAPPVYAPPADFGGWYLRGDIGMTNQSLSRIESNTVAWFPQSAQAALGFDNSPRGLRGDNLQLVPGLTNSSVASFGDNGKWNFAWATHAALARGVTPSVTLELAYSYIDLGSVRPGAFTFIDGPNGSSPVAQKNITSNDVTLGAQRLLEPQQVYPPQPVTKG